MAEQQKYNNEEPAVFISAEVRESKSGSLYVSTTEPMDLDEAKRTLSSNKVYFKVVTPKNPKSDGERILIGSAPRGSLKAKTPMDHGTPDNDDVVV